MTWRFQKLAVQLIELEATRLTVSANWYGSI